MATGGTTYYLPKPELVGEALLKRVASIRRLNKQYDDYQIAAALGLPIETYQGRLAWAENQHNDAKKRMKTWKIGTPLYIQGNAVIVGDVHCPFVNWEYAHLVSKIGKKHLEHPRQLIIAGDYFNLDVFSFYEKLVKGSPKFEDEEKAAAALGEEWASVFDMIYFTTGNHDRRISKRLDGEMDIEELSKFTGITAAKQHVSVFGYCFLESNGISWRISHAKEYSINRLTVANELALKFQTNIVSFHEHHQAIGWDRFGRYCIVNGGSLCCQDEMAYAMIDDTKKPVWNTGFVLIRDGVPSLFGKSPITRWEDWL